MPFDVNGNYTLPAPFYPLVSGTLAKAEDVNTIASDLATGLNTALQITGVKSMSGPLGMGSNKITSLAPGTVGADAVNFTQLQAVKGLAVNLTGLVNGELFAATAGFTVSVGATAGNVFSVYNDSALSITLTSGAGLTLRLGGTASVGDRTLAQRGVANIVCRTATDYVITGVGLT